MGDTNGPWYALLLGVGLGGVPTRLLPDRTVVAALAIAALAGAEGGVAVETGSVTAPVCG